MCDTFIAMGEVAKNGNVLFGKNSDREPNEPQGIIFMPPKHQLDKTVKTTYVEIPQVPYTRGLIISRPSWIWGGEMGVNDCGVVIGNEAVFTKEPVMKIGLLGMDILRLTLERADSAERAMELIIQLINDHGQGGNGGYLKKLYYHNSFIVADRKKGFKIETAGKYWVAKEIKGIASISNALTIESNFDFKHPEVINHAVKRHWYTGKENFRFNDAYGRKIYAKLSGGEIRKKRVDELLITNNHKLDVRVFMDILRDHAGIDNIQQGSMKTICMHGGGVISSQTTSSMVCEISDLVTTWITGTSVPCLSLFKPVWFDNKSSTLPYETLADALKLWFHWERFHRLSLKKFSQAKKIIDEFGKKLEEELLDTVEELSLKDNIDFEKLKEITENAFADFWKLGDDLINKIKEYPDSKTSHGFVNYWNKQNRMLRKKTAKKIIEKF